MLNRFDINVKNLTNYNKLCFLIIPLLKLTIEEKQKFLEINDIYDRLKSIMEFISGKNNSILSISNENLHKKINKEKSISINENKNINNPFNFGSMNNNNNDKNNILKELQEKIEKAEMTEEAKKIAYEELGKLKTSKGSPEYDWTLNYLNILVSLPWNILTIDSNDISYTKEILDKDHYGLKKVKKRIIEYLAVRKLNNSNTNTNNNTNSNTNNNTSDNVNVNSNKLVKQENKENKIKESNNNLNNTDSNSNIKNSTEKINSLNIKENINLNLNLNLNKNKNGSILCFNGPPGVGKTSLAKSIADALGKKFYRISLGGLKEVSEINGHRRTFIASMPGMIIQALKRIQTKNPVILLDEIDKVGINVKGDVSSSLLEVLDPEQNSTFKDHYLNTPFDLSQIFFICTSNYLENISPPLRDRLEIINIPGYTPLEKIQICKNYLIPKQINLNGLNIKGLKIHFHFSDEILNQIILNYTFESGVRELDRKISAICRNFAKEIVEEIDNNNYNKDKNNKENLKLNLNTDSTKIIEIEKNYIITEKILEEILGKKRHEIDLNLRVSNPGVAIVNKKFNKKFNKILIKNFIIFIRV
jgi:ATP-dependent Lon protease